MEDALAGREGDVFPLEELAHGGVIDDADERADDFDLEVQVADDPTETRSGRSVGAKSNLEDRLVFLRDDVNSGVIGEDGGVIKERGFEGEAEFTAILGDAAPAALGKNQAIDRDAQCGKSAVPVREGGVDEVQGNQNRK